MSKTRFNQLDKNIIYDRFSSDLSAEIVKVSKTNNLNKSFKEKLNVEQDKANSHNKNGE